MYDFRDLRQIQDDYLSLPSTAMSFNGSFIEDEISGYRTLNVSGRESLNYDIETSGTVSGRDGVLPISKTLSERALTVQYQLIAETNEEFQAAFDRLKWLLHSDNEVPIGFIDEPDITYYGQLSSIERVPPDANAIVGEFIILCSDPYKKEEEVIHEGNPITIYLRSPYESKPDEVEIRLNSNTDKITVDNINTGRHIILDGEYSAGDVIKISIPDNEITRNGQNIMMDLDYTETDFHRFMIKDGDEIKVTPSSADMKIGVRGRWK